MMKIDYNPGYSRFIEGLSEPFVMAAQMRRQRRQDDEYKRQNDLSQRRLAMQDQQQRLLFEQQQADRNTKLLDDLVKTGQTQGEGAAAAKAKLTQFYDPRTGTMRGVGYEPGRDEVSPGAVAEHLGSNPLKLEMPNPGSAAEPPPGMGLANLPEFQLRKPTFPGDQLEEPEFGRGLAPKPPQQQLGMQQLPDVSAFRRKTLPAIIGPGGERMEFDPEEGKRKQAEETRATATQMRARAAELAVIDPATAKYYANAADRLELTLPGSERAQLQRMEGQIAGQEFKAGEGAKRDATKVKIAGMPARRGAGGGVNPTKAAKADLDVEAKKLDIEGKINSHIRLDIVQPLGFKDINTQARKIDDLASSIAGAGENPALKAIGLGQFVKLAQGGTGVVSDQDVTVFWDRIGGIGVRSKEAFRNALDGNLGPDKQKAVQEAIAELQSRAQANANRIGKAISDDLTVYAGGAYKDRIPRFLNTFAPDYARQYEAGQANQGDVSARQSRRDRWKAQMKGAR